MVKEFLPLSNESAVFWDVGLARLDHFF